MQAHELVGAGAITAPEAVEDEGEVFYIPIDKMSIAS